MFGSHQLRAVSTIFVVLILFLQIAGYVSVAVPQAAASEVIDLRTANAKVFRSSDGSGYAQIFAYPIHYQTASGAWANIRTELIPLTGADAWSNMAGDVAVQFRAASGASDTGPATRAEVPLVRLADEGRSLAFVPVGARAVSGQVDGSRITYPDVYDGVDLRYINGPASLKEDLVFRRLPVQTSFTFRLEVSGLAPRLDDDGGITFEPCDQTCWTILPPYLEDASGASSEAVIVELNDLGDGAYNLIYTPDAAWLTDPARVYPVVLDPSVDTRGSGDTLYTQQGFPNTAGYKQRFLSLGYDPENNGKAITRAFFYAPLPALPAGSTIDSATLNMYQYYAPLTTGYNTVGYRVTTPWQTNPAAYNWNNSPVVDGTVITSAAVSRNRGWNSWNVTGLVQQWYSGVPNNGVALHASPESTRGAYFCSSHALGTQCSSTVDALQLRPYFVINYTTTGPGPTSTPITPVPTPTPKPYVPPASPRLTITPGSVDLNVIATVLLEGVNPNHRVRLISSRGSADVFGAAVGTTDSLGRFSTTIRSGSAGTATITARNETTGQSFATSAQISFRSTPPAPRPAVITGVASTWSLNGSYPAIDKIPCLASLATKLNSTIRVTVDWKGNAPGSVDFRINGRLASVGANSTGATYQLNVGRDLLPGRNSITITARNAQGLYSNQMSFSPNLWTADWLRGLCGVVNFVDIGEKKVKIELLVPIEKTAATKTILFPGAVGLDGFQFYAKIEIPIDDISSGVKIRGGRNAFSEEEMRRAAGRRDRNGIVVYDTRLSADYYIEGEGGYRNGSPYLDTGSIGVETSLRIEKRWSVLVVLSATGAGAPVYQVIDRLRLDEFLKKYAFVYVAATPSLRAEAQFGLNPLQFRALRAGMGLDLEAGLRFEVPGGIGEARVYVGADGSIIFCFPDTRVCEWRVAGRAGFNVRVSAWLINVDFGSEWEIKQEYKGQSMVDSSTDVLRLIPHPNTKGYGRFQAHSGTLQSFSGMTEVPQLAGLDEAAVTPLVTSVYTYTEPTLALNPISGNSLLLWVHDDTSKPIGQSHELKFSRWDGSAWSLPNNVTIDNVIDGAPQVSWDGSGNAVAVWSRVREPLPTDSTFDEQTAKKLEIATSIYNATTSTWSSPSLLTSNDALDMTPRLARNVGGEILAAWRQNSAGILSGNVTNPDRIVIARFSQGGWQAPIVALDGIPGLADLAIGLGTDTATIAFTRALTTAGASASSLQLFTSTRTANGWSAPIQLTNDELGHRSPQVFYNATNQPLLVWLAGSELQLHNLTTGTTRSLVVPAEVGGIDELRVVQDSAGNVTAVFTAQASQRDLYVSFYDEATGLWGQPRQLTSNRDSEAYPAVALDGGGRLLMTYASTAVTLQDRTATDPATGQSITYTVPVEGQTDLLTLSKTFVRNLTITDAQLTLSNPLPRAGDVIQLSAIVSNTGDLPVSPVAVRFFDGNPAAGGTLLGTSTRSQPLAAGDTTSLSLDYTVPASGGVREIYAVVDPGSTVSESDEADNTARITALGPNLLVEYAAAEPWSGTLVGLTSVIRNIGTTTAPPSTLAYLRDTPSGSVFASESLPALAAGEVITLTTPLDYGSLAAGDYTTLAQVNRGNFAEVSTANNTYTTTLTVRPDLLVPVDDIVLRQVSSTAAEITVTVYNNGSITALDVPVQVYRRGTLEPTAQLFSQVIPSIQPGGSATVNGTIEGLFGCGIFVAANSEQTLPEMTYLNNLASLPATGGSCADFTYTPGSGIEGASVTFTDTSSGTITSWEWSFGDGTTSTERNPTHVYNKPGTYDVTLRISGSEGNDEYTRTGAVVVYPDPGKTQTFLPLVRR